MTRCSKEQAISVLERYPEMDQRLKAYWEAIIDGTLPAYYLTEFTKMRDQFSDDLPDVDVRNLPVTQGERPHVFKSQRNFLVGLGDLRTAVKDEVIKDRAVIEAIDSLLSSDLNFSVGDSDNRNRIERINNTLNAVIAHLQTIV